MSTQTLFPRKETERERQGKKAHAHSLLTASVACVLLLALASYWLYRKASNEQRADPHFDARVATPASQIFDAGDRILRLAPELSGLR